MLMQNMETDTAFPFSLPPSLLLYMSKSSTMEKVALSDGPDLVCSGKKGEKECLGGAGWKAFLWLHLIERME